MVIMMRLAKTTLGKPAPVSRTTWLCPSTEYDPGLRGPNLAKSSDSGIDLDNHSTLRLSSVTQCRTAKDDKCVHSMGLRYRANQP